MAPKQSKMVRAQSEPLLPLRRKIEEAEESDEKTWFGKPITPIGHILYPDPETLPLTVVVSKLELYQLVNKGAAMSQSKVQVVVDCFDADQGSDNDDGDTPGAAGSGDPMPVPDAETLIH